MKKTFLFILCSMLLLSACGSPAPSVIEAAGQTTEPEADSAANTPAPTATLAPEPQVINGENAANLAFQGLVDLPRKTSVAWPYVIYSGDSQHIAVTTEAGVDVLNSKTLEFETSFPGLRVDGSLEDGRLYGWKDGGFDLSRPRRAK
jgi:hypothetical protein